LLLLFFSFNMHTPIHLTTHIYIYMKHSWCWFLEFDKMYWCEILDRNNNADFCFIYIRRKKRSRKFLIRCSHARDQMSQLLNMRWEFLDWIVTLGYSFFFCFSNVCVMNVKINEQILMNDIDIYSILLLHDLVSNDRKSKIMYSIVRM
jgi:hypothetical protein